jgi:hypothetical protein
MSICLCRLERGGRREGEKGKKTFGFLNSWETMVFLVTGLHGIFCCGLWFTEG